MPDKEIILDMRSNCECKDASYCPLEKLVERMSADLFEQHKCVEILKWDRHLPDNDEGWRQAYFIWVEEGFAKAYREVYQQGMKHREIIFAVYEKMRLEIKKD